MPARLQTLFHAPRIVEDQFIGLSVARQVRQYRDQFRRQMRLAAPRRGLEQIQLGGALMQVHIAPDHAASFADPGRLEHENAERTQMRQVVLNGLRVESSDPFNRRRDLHLGAFGVSLH